jgi:hypothetical protein
LKGITNPLGLEMNALELETYIISLHNERISKQEFEGILKRAYKESTLSTKEFRETAITSIMKMVGRAGIKPNKQTITNKIKTLALWRKR